jgi:hypothetical protein
MRTAANPLHRPGRAELPHPVPTLGQRANTVVWEGRWGVNPPPTREIGCSVCAGVETLYAQGRGQVMCDKLQNKEGYC